MICTFLKLAKTEIFLYPFFTVSTVNDVKSYISVYTRSDDQLLQKTIIYVSAILYIICYQRFNRFILIQE